MHEHKYIVDTANRLVELCGTRDPFRIAGDIGINVGFYDLGSLKGMYCIIKRNRMVAINSGMDEYMQRLVCAHEIGHDILHRAVVKDTLVREFELYHTKDNTEYEANVFCAELLIDDSDVAEMLELDYTLEGMAATLGVDSQLMAFKLENMRLAGFDVHPTERRSDFLRK